MKYFSEFLCNLKSIKTFKNEGYQTAFFNKQYIKYNIWAGEC